MTQEEIGCPDQILGTPYNGIKALLTHIQEVHPEPEDEELQQQFLAILNMPDGEEIYEEDEWISDD